MNLTEKQKRFCDEYLIDLNATQAAIRAGYSKKTAAVIGAENLIKPNIQEYIQERQKSLANKLQITQEMVLEGYRKLAFYDVRKFYDENNHLLDISKLDEETSFALVALEVTEAKTINAATVYTKKIKMSDRKGALDSICRMLGFNASEKHEVSAQQRFLKLLMETS